MRSRMGHCPSVGYWPREQRLNLGLVPSAQSTFLSFQKSNSHLSFKPQSWGLLLYAAPCPPILALLLSLLKGLSSFSQQPSSLLPAWALGPTTPFLHTLLAVTPGDRHYHHPHFTEEESEAERGEDTS
jgi:hypothetical protein